MKVYQKRGNTNYKEKKLIADLNEAIKKKIAADPSFADKFQPATNYEELKKLHSTYCVEDVNFTEVAAEPANNTAGQSEPVSENTGASDADTGDVFVDPFNSEQPIIRDYVKDDGFHEKGTAEHTTRASFDEPTSFEESFKMPEDSPEDSQGGGGGNGGNKKEPKTKREPSEPMNPHFDEMTAGKKRRSTKKFAKYIVETILALSQKGFVWFANKDINEAKLAEYEINDEIDLTLLLTLDNRQEITVKEFFIAQCKIAEETFTVEDDEKQDLIDALAEVMLEKGVAPTPMQELLLIAAKIFGTQIVSLIALKSQSNGLLRTLRDRKAGIIEEYEEQPPRREQTTHQHAQANTQPQTQHAPVVDEPSLTEQPVAEQPLVEEELPIIDKPIETKE